MAKREGKKKLWTLDDGEAVAATWQSYYTNATILLHTSPSLFSLSLVYIYKSPGHA